MTLDTTVPTQLGVYDIVSKIAEGGMGTVYKARNRTTGEIVEIGKQLLMTRGALTTFSIANDVAKYFAIIPAAFVTTYPQLNALNLMRLTSPFSAILSAVIFNALIIVFLIPLALKGVRYRPLGAAPLLRRNLLVYGLGGILVPFAGIKLVDLCLVLTRLV